MRVMEYLVVNLRGRTRRTTFQGRKFLVAPATLIVPGVLSGSKGPHLYPLEEIRRNPDSWNGIPIVVYHPYKDGKPVSAQSPDILEKQQVGWIFSSHANGRLRAELYFDEEKTRKVDERVLDALYKNKPMELSTGLHVESEPAPENSSYSGKQYSFVARNYKPDHLAILPDQTGACSLEDGCGLNVNSQGRFELELVLNSIAPDYVMNPKGQWEPPEAGDAPEEVKKILRAVYSQWRDEHPSEDAAVKAKGAKIAWGAVKRAGWKKDAKGKWHKSQKTSNKEDTMDPLSEEQRTSLVEQLINDCDCWDEEDKDVLSNLSDEKLQKLVANVTRSYTSESKSTSSETIDLNSIPMNDLMEEMKRRKEMVGNDGPSGDTMNKRLTAEEWLEQAPEEVKATFRYAHQIEQEQKDALVEKLTANIKDGTNKKIQAERLRRRSIDDLKADVELLPEVQASAPVENTGGKATSEADSAWLSSALSKMGREPDDEPLPLPTINWAESDEEGPGVTSSGILETPTQDPEQWLRSAPNHIREVVQNAFKSEQREKDEIISRLVENIEDSTKRFRMRDRLEARPLSELREMMDLIPRKQTDSPKKSNYIGAAAPATNRLSDEDKDDILLLPSMSFEKTG
jgi:cation transport regulator ChaB